MHEVESGQFGFLSGAALGPRGHQETLAEHQREPSSVSKTSAGTRAQRWSCKNSDTGILRDTPQN